VDGEQPAEPWAWVDGGEAWPVSEDPVGRDVQRRSVMPSRRKRFASDVGGGAFGNPDPASRNNPRYGYGYPMPFGRERAGKGPTGGGMSGKKSKRRRFGAGDALRSVFGGK